MLAIILLSIQFEFEIYAHAGELLRIATIIILCFDLYINAYSTPTSPIYNSMIMTIPNHIPILISVVRLCRSGFYFNRVMSSSVIKIQRMA